MNFDLERQEFLYGSSILPSHVNILGKTHQLGAIVARAFTNTRMTTQQWNSMPESGREDLLLREINLMRAGK